MPCTVIVGVVIVKRMIDRPKGGGTEKQVREKKKMVQTTTQAIMVTFSNTVLYSTKLTSCVTP